MRNESVLEGGGCQGTYEGHAGNDLAAPPSNVSASDGAESLVSVASHSVHDLRADPASVDREGRAVGWLKASTELTAPPDLIDAIRLNYRLAKSAEQSRIGIDQRLVSFVRVYLTAWTPKGEEIDRKKHSAQAMRVIDTVRDGAEPKAEDAELCEMVASMVAAMEPTREAYEVARKLHRKEVERAVKKLPAWERIGHVRGFSLWGLGALIGEAGDIGQYSGCRKLYKRLGLAPNECYPKGEGKNTGRMIPRNARGRIMGIIADAFLRAQWRGEKEDCPAHAIGPYGEVYRTTKERHLAAGKTKAHADKTARRAMVKALIHDVHRAWHGQTLTYL